MNSGAGLTQPCGVSGLIRNKGSHSGSVMGIVRSVHALRLGTVEIGSQVCFSLITRRMLISIHIINSKCSCAC